MVNNIIKSIASLLRKDKYKIYWIKLSFNLPFFCKKGDNKNARKIKESDKS